MTHFLHWKCHSDVHSVPVRSPVSIRTKDVGRLPRCLSPCDMCGIMAVESILPIRPRTAGFEAQLLRDSGPDSEYRPIGVTGLHRAKAMPNHPSLLTVDCALSLHMEGSALGHVVLTWASKSERPEFKFQPWIPGALPTRKPLPQSCCCVQTKKLFLLCLSPCRSLSLVVGDGDENLFCRGWETVVNSPCFPVRLLWGPRPRGEHSVGRWASPTKAPMLLRHYGASGKGFTGPWVVKGSTLLGPRDLPCPPACCHGILEGPDLLVQSWRLWQRSV